MVAARRRMYKDRFNSWRMFKNLRKNDFKDVARQLKEPQCRDSEILISGKKVSMARMQRYLNRHGESNLENANIIPKTLEANSVGSTMGTAAKKTPRALLLGVDVKDPFDVQSFRAPHGEGISVGELLVLRTKGATQIMDEEVDKGILSLQTAFTGLRDFYKPSHPSVVQTAWCLAEGYVRIQEIESADEIVNWISSGYSQDLSLYHPRTLDHYLSVVKMLQEWGRSQDARSLGFRLFAAIRDKAPSSKVVMVRQSSEPDCEFCSIADDAEFQQIFDERSDMDEVDQQLKLASIWSAARLPGMQPVMEKLILRFSSLSSVLRGWEVKARCIYIRALNDEKAYDAVRSECKLAQSTLSDLICHANPPSTADLICLCAEVLRIFHRVKDTSGIEELEKWRKNLLLGLVKPFEGTGGRTNCLGSISHLSDIGSGYQRRFKQIDAEIWFEWANKLSAHELGSHSLISQLLDRAVKERYYDDSQVLGSV
ncbi:hypothetical protein NW767_009143 [Fusarium falciforme]|nr:hypothetical protein NW767_009143 [Fusarium falciforme]